MKLTRLSDFIRGVVATRQLPPVEASAKPPTVLMKMDIEGEEPESRSACHIYLFSCNSSLSLIFQGAEVETLSDMMLTGAFQFVTRTMVEFHDRLTSDARRGAMSVDLRKGLEALQKVLGKQLIKSVDDESYGQSDFPLPKCNPKQEERQASSVKT